MAPIDVDPATYSSAATRLNTAAQNFYSAVTGGINGLEGTDEMGGSVGECADWSSSYDDTVGNFKNLSISLADAMHHYAGILQQVGYNHACADYDPASGLPPPAEPVPLPPPTLGGIFPYIFHIPPSAGGPGNGLIETGVEGTLELLDHIGVPIPDGDPGRLGSAADTWEKLAGDEGIGALPAELEAIAVLFDTVTADDVELIDEDLRDMKAAAEDLITTCSDLATACRDQKSTIDGLRAKLIEYLESLAVEIAVEVAEGMVIGWVLGAVTVGFGAAAVALYKAGKITVKVKKWAGKIKTLVEATKLASKVKVTKTVDKSKENMQRIRDLVRNRSDDVSGKSSLGSKGPDLQIDDKQFGKKIGKHAQDYGLDPSDPNSRAWLRQHFDDIRNNPDEVRKGPYHAGQGGGENYWFYKQGDDLLIVNEEGKFVTSFPMKGTNSWFEGATPQ